MIGLFPTETETETETYFIVGANSNGLRVSGIIPTLGGTSSTPVPTAIPTTAPTSSPTAAPGISRVEVVNLTPGAGFNGRVIRSGFKPSSATPTFSNATEFRAPSTPLGGDDNFTFEGPILTRPARVGDVFNLQNRSAALGILYYSEATGSGPARAWESTGGTMRITAANATSVSFTLQGVTFSPQSFDSTSATGTFTLGDTGQFSR